MNDSSDEGLDLNHFRDLPSSDDEDLNKNKKLTKEQALQIVPKDPVNIRHPNVSILQIFSFFNFYHFFFFKKWFENKLKPNTKELRSKITRLFFNKNYQECCELCEKLQQKINLKKSSKNNRQSEDILEILVNCQIELGENEKALKNSEKLVIKK